MRLAEELNEIISPYFAEGQEALAKAHRLKVERAIEQLPADQRIVLRLRMAGFRTSEIAAHLNETQSAISQRLYRTKALLSGLIDGTRQQQRNSSISRKLERISRENVELQDEITFLHEQIRFLMSVAEERRAANLKFYKAAENLLK